MSHKKLIIIGAGRSGTNMLRDALTMVPGVGTWPCDEINYIWRHGNRGWATDELTAAHARPAVCTFIRNAFARIARRKDLAWVVEKTCANSVRVPFVHHVVPDARFVLIVRDGRDVVSSAMKRWRAPLDLRYILAKARFVPPSDVPYYAIRYLANRMSSLTNEDRRLASWGPRCDGLHCVLRKDGLVAACAHQWARCVSLASAALDSLPQDRVVRIRYEEFVREPLDGLERIAALLDQPLPRQAMDAAARFVSPASVGKWRTDLDAEALASVMPHLRSTLIAHGYDAA